MAVRALFSSFTLSTQPIEHHCALAAVQISITAHNPQDNPILIQVFQTCHFTLQSNFSGVVQLRLKAESCLKPQVVLPDCALLRLWWHAAPLIGQHTQSAELMLRRACIGRQPAKDKPSSSRSVQSGESVQSYFKGAGQMSWRRQLGS